jgi:hypothetical protein
MVTRPTASPPGNSARCSPGRTVRAGRTRSGTNSQRDELAAGLLRERWGAARDVADLIDLASLHPEIRQQLTRVFGQLDSTDIGSRRILAQRRGRLVGAQTRRTPLICGFRADNIGAMSTLGPDLEEPEQVLTYLASAIRAIKGGLDHGVSMADSFFADGLMRDPWLWAHLARYGARSHLAGLEPEDWEPGRELANSGLEIKRMPLVLRTLKARGEGPPNPGTNAARRGYWSQSPRLPLKLGDALMPEGANFILDWSVNKERQLFLALSKPIGIWKYGQTPKLEWRKGFEDDDEGLRFIPSDEEALPIEDVFDTSEFDEEEDQEE